MLSSEKAQSLLDKLSHSIQRERLIPQDLEEEVIQWFARVGGDEMVVAVLYARYQHTLDILMSTQHVGDLTHREDIRSFEVTQAFLEATVLLAAAVEANLMGDEEVSHFVRVTSAHHMRHHFLNAASDHFSWSHSNFLWDALTDRLLSN